MTAALYESYDPRFRRLILPTAALEELHADCRWAEGPVWFGDAGCLLWSDIPNDRILRWVEGGGTSVFRAPANFANGHTRDRLGRLVSCEHGGRRVTRTEPDGTVTVLAERFAGRRLNSPNDVVVQSTGAIWFTDPTYGIMTDYEGHRAEPEQDARGVYRIDPLTGEVSRMVDDFVQPNGLAFSPDERRLYVADSAFSHDDEAPRHVRVFDLRDDGTLGGGAVFATIEAGVPDGMRVDVEGNVWCSAGDGVRVFAPDGTPLGRIAVPQAVANLAFGGPRRNRLFIAATRSLYSVYVGVSGAQVP